MFKKISIFVCSISIFLATACNAGTMTFEPNVPRVFTNIMRWSETIACDFQGDFKEVSMEAKMLKKSGKVNDIELSEGDTYNFITKYVLHMDFEGDSQIQITNLSSKSVTADCVRISI